MTEISHPRYGAPLGGAPITVNGVVFRPYRVGIMRTCRCSDDFRITVSHVEGRRNAGGHYTVALDGVYLVGADGERAKRFRDQKNAMREGVREWRERGAIPHSRL